MMFIDPKAATPSARVGAAPRRPRSRGQAGDRCDPEAEPRQQRDEIARPRRRPAPGDGEPPRGQRGACREHVRLGGQRLFDQPDAGAAGQARDDQFQPLRAVLPRRREGREVEARRRVLRGAGAGFRLLPRIREGTEAEAFDQRTPPRSPRSEAVLRRAPAARRNARRPRPRRPAR